MNSALTLFNFQNIFQTFEHDHWNSFLDRDIAKGTNPPYLLSGWIIYGLFDLLLKKKWKHQTWAFTTVVHCFPGWGRWERLSPQYSSLSPPSSTAAPGWSLSLVRLVFVIGQVGLHSVHHSHILDIDAITLVVFIVSILLFWFWQSPSISGLPEERPSQGRRRWLCSSRFESNV